jgi:hypothetical protein
MSQKEPDNSSWGVAIAKSNTDSIPALLSLLMMRGEPLKQE